MMDLVKEFEKTRRVSKKYFPPLERSRVYRDGNEWGYPKKIIFTGDTVKSIFENRGHIAALNFADAFSPGGEVLLGAGTQEECLCRSSNLYEYLIAEPEFYDYDGDDLIMVSDDVKFFRDENLRWRKPEDIRSVRVITAASMIFPLVDEVETKRRMRAIIRAAASYEILLLGKWGCGAFGNDWNLFRRWWSEVIKEIGKPMEVEWDV